MSRPRKIINEEIDEMATGIKQVQRVVSKQNITNPAAGFFSVADVDAYLTSLVQDGWKLSNSFYLGEVPEGFIIWYVFVKE